MLGWVRGLDKPKHKINRHDSFARFPNLFRFDFCAWWICNHSFWFCRCSVWSWKMHVLMWWVPWTLTLMPCSCLITMNLELVMFVMLSRRWCVCFWHHLLRRCIVTIHYFLASMWVRTYTCRLTFCTSFVCSTKSSAWFFQLIISIVTIPFSHCHHPLKWHLVINIVRIIIA